MTTKNIIAILLLLLFANKAELKAQELSNYNLYSQNGLLYNPAHTVSDYKLYGFANSHLQWIGFENAPKVETFGISSAIDQNSAFGVMVHNTSAGLVSEFDIKLNYAYLAILGNEHYIKMGLSAGYMQYRLSRPNEMVDITDNLITNEEFNGASFSARAGLFYYFRGAELQFSMPQLFNRKELNTYAIGSVAYNYEVNNDLLLKPTFTARSAAHSPAQFDASIMARWQDKIWLETGYRTQNSLIVALGVNVAGLDIAYAYQRDGGKLTRFSNGTHEIQLAYSFKKIERKTRSRAPKAKKTKTPKTQFSGVVTDSLSKETLIAKVAIVKNDTDTITTITTAESGNFATEVEKGEELLAVVSSKGYYTERLESIASSNAKVQVKLIPRRISLKGSVSVNNTAEVARLNIYNKAGVTIAKTSTNSMGAFEVKLESGMQYTIEVESDKYGMLQRNITIPERVAEYSLDFRFAPAYTFTVSAKDAKTGKLVNGKCELFAQETLLETFAFRGKESKAFKQKGNYTLRISAPGYLSQKLKIELSDENNEIELEVELKKFEKGKAFQLGNIGFKSGTAQITTSSFAVLDKLTETLNNNPELRIEVAGHTDSDGSKVYNKNISKQRAMACVNYLSKNGIDKKRMIAVGYGESSPIVPNTTTANKSKNRRVEFKFVD